MTINLDNIKNIFYKKSLIITKKWLYIQYINTDTKYWYFAIILLFESERKKDTCNKLFKIKIFTVSIYFYSELRI